MNELIFSAVLGFLVVFSLGLVGLLIYLVSFIHYLKRERAEKIQNQRQIYNLFPPFKTILTLLDDLQQQIRQNEQIYSQQLSEKTRDLAHQVHQFQLQNKLLEKAQQELMMTNEELDQERAQAQAMLESIGEGLIVVDLTNRIKIINRAALIMLNWDYQKVINQRLSDFIRIQNETGQSIQPDDHPLHKALVLGKKAATSDYYYCRPDQTRFPVFISTAPIQLNRAVIGAVEVFRDVSVEKEVDRAKTEFVSLASHQLRTPLTAISWYTEALLREKLGTLNDKQKRYLNQVYQGNQRMISLVNALLNVSRIELGTFMVNPEPTDLRKIAEDNLRELDIEIQTKQLQIKKEFAPELPLINVDPNLVNLVLQNLLSNAVKYTPENGTITIKLSAEDHRMLITVADTGYGIPQDQQRRVFSKLFRASNVTEKETQGTGLGLYTVKSMLEKTGGSIWFESQENQGAAFYVQLPLSGMAKRAGTRALN